MSGRAGSGAGGGDGSGGGGGRRESNGVGWGWGGVYAGPGRAADASRKTVKALEG